MAACLAFLPAVLGLPAAGVAEEEDLMQCEVLVMQMVTVTGVLHLASLPAGQGSTLELDVEKQGRFRISEEGRGAELMAHVGDMVTIFAFLEPYSQDDLPVLRVERFSLHET